MKEIYDFIKAYYHGVNKPALVLCTLFVAFLVWLNYGLSMESWLINRAGLPVARFTGHFLIYSMAFLFPYFLLIANKKILAKRGFWACLFIAPALFALKVSMPTTLNFAGNDDWNSYWNNIIYWPLRMVALVVMLWMCWLRFNRNSDFYGLGVKWFNLMPYLVMLLIMVPLVAAASTQPDFLAVYPKLDNILPLPDGAQPGWIYKILFEISYGTDFFSVEIFFRGFLVLGFLKWAGKDAILPMACFYCSIHFGKPMGECISSYFGGLLLGIVSYHTRSIYGGLIVHLGIAWLMELGGFLGNQLLK